MNRQLFKLQISIALCATALMPALTFADYQFKNYASYNFSGYDEVNEDTALLDIGDSFYLKPVPTEGVLLGEAAFLSKSSSLGISYNEIETSWSFSGISGSSNTDFTQVYGRYILEQDRDYIIAGGVLRGDYDVFHSAGDLYLDDHSEILLGFSSSD
jgi:hypothetical protein